MIQTMLFYKLLNTFLPKRGFCSKSPLKKICIVGSGPGGFYTARALLRENGQLCEVDIFDKLIAPCGLVRYGVAPDHPEIKVVESEFNNIIRLKRCNYYGNVHVGKDVSVAELLNTYHGVVLACGAESAKKLGIPGEESANVFSANQFVSWYNSHPNFVNLDVNLDSEVALVIGNGNVAIDVARILLLDIDVLRKTDIAEHALEVLKKSKIKKVILAGRRGPLQAAFTTKEFRELKDIASTKIHREDLANVEEIIPSLERTRRRTMQLLSEVAKTEQTKELNRSMEVKFYRSPKAIIPNSKGTVEKVLLGINKLKSLENMSENSDVVDTGEEEVVDCGLVLKSIGYQCSPLDSLVPFDSESNTIPNDKGRVLNAKGLYCSGWNKTGPKGVILTTLHSSFETAETIWQDFDNDNLSTNPTMSREDLLNVIKNRGVKYVTFDGWMKINQVEEDRGKAKGKPREKICSVEEMLSIGGMS